MRHLWRDMMRQRAATWTFAAAWVALWAWTQLTRNGPTGDISPAPAILQLFGPIIAGALVAWFRTRAPEAHPFGYALRGGTLAGTLVMLVNIAVLFLIEAVHAKRAADIFGGMGEFVEWLIAFGIFGVLLGFIGAIAGSSLARLGSARRTAREMSRTRPGDD